MKVVLFAATGMVGQGVLRERLLDPEVKTVLAIGRKATAQWHEKLHEIVLNDLSDLSSADTPRQKTCFVAAWSWDPRSTPSPLRSGRPSQFPMRPSHSGWKAR